MKLIVDQNIPLAQEAFGTLGEVTTLPGRGITPEHLRDADALIVRSITKVNAALLDGSPVRFVGTCTIGEDHIDKPYLASRGIGFASAPGCNANSVSEYISATLLELEAHFPLTLRQASLGIIGFGHVGKKVAAKARALGMRVVVNDPPLEDVTCEQIYRPLHEALACDVVTLHVPLERGGEYPTFHLVNGQFLSAMKRGAILMNTSRGPVVDSAALIRALDDGHLSAAVLDVWEGEPEVPEELITRAFIATPHIAGYSYDGKVNGTEQIYRAACRHFGLEERWSAEAALPAPDVPHITVETEGLREIVKQVYDIRQDDTALREALALPASERGPYFDGLRKHYPRRREWRHTAVTLPPTSAELAAPLKGLGFRVEAAH
jgi:erythronate-4-phosphate dehydrogenase